MAKSFRTPMSRVKGHGSAQEGTAHYIAHRVSAIFLAVLAPLFIWGMISAAPAGYDGFIEYLSSTWGALVTLGFITAAFYHGRSGLTESILDYFQGGARLTLLFVAAALAIGFWLLAVLSVLRIWLGA